MSSVFVVPVLTPHGHLILSEDRDASAPEPELARRLQNAFARGSGHGLLQLGGEGYARAACLQSCNQILIGSTTVGSTTTVGISQFRRTHLPGAQVNWKPGNSIAGYLVDGRQTLHDLKPQFNAGARC